MRLAARLAAYLALFACGCRQQRAGEQREADEVWSSLNAIKHQGKNAGCLHAAGGPSCVICMRLAANYGTFCIWLAAFLELFAGDRLQTSRQYWL
jgi:hypothetical protein